MWSLSIAESGLSGLRGVAAALECVVTGREKLLREKWAMVGAERGSAPVAKQRHDSQNNGVRQGERGRVGGTRESLKSKLTSVRKRGCQR